MPLDPITTQLAIRSGTEIILALIPLFRGLGMSEEAEKLEDARTALLARSDATLDRVIDKARSS